MSGPCGKCGSFAMLLPRYLRIASTRPWLLSNRRSFVLPTARSTCVVQQSMTLHTTSVRWKKPEQEKQPETRVVMKKFFLNDDKDKQTFLTAMEFFTREDVTHRRGHVDFIYAALRHMEEYGVQRDLEAYKKILDVFPKERFIPQNVFQAEFLHFPKQQFCAVDLLEQMEDNAVIPDEEMGQMLLKIFGKNAVPLRKYQRMMYWMPKFKHLSPWSLPDPVPDDAYELAKLAMARLGSVDIQSEIMEYETKDVEDAIDDTWIVGVQSPTQKELMSMVPDKRPVYVEGPFLLWLRKSCIAYFIMRCDPLRKYGEVEEDDVSKVGVVFKREKELLPVKSVKPSIHEQDDGIILAACATGTSSSDSLLSWVRLMQKSNPRLGEVPVVFAPRSPVGAVIKVGKDGKPDFGAEEGEGDKQLVIRNIRASHEEDEVVRKRLGMLNVASEPSTDV